MALKKEVLEDYWYNMPYYDGTYAIPPEVYLTKNYVVNSKKDTRPWNTIINEYFCLKDYFTDFDHSFLALTASSSQRTFSGCPECPLTQYQETS